jgi:hypothetical protein
MGFAPEHVLSAARTDENKWYRRFELTGVYTGSMPNKAGMYGLPLGGPIGQLGFDASPAILGYAIDRSVR